VARARMASEALGLLLQRVFQRASRCSIAAELVAAFS